MIFFVFCFIKTQPFVKRKPVKTEKSTGTIAFRFKQVLLYLEGPEFGFVPEYIVRTVFTT
jgi:hypothetical protein